MSISEKTLKWLLEGDPSIRWQVMQDLLDEPAETVTEERQKIAGTGWGARLLSFQDESGTWGKSLYSGKWLSTTYTVLLLRRMGLDPGNEQAKKACRLLLDEGYCNNGEIRYHASSSPCDIGVVGLILSLLAYFEIRDERLDSIVTFLLHQQFPDGRWEPFPNNTHLTYTLACTLIVLEGLGEYEPTLSSSKEIVIQAQQQGREFLLSHRLFKHPASEKVIDSKMTLFSFPPRWKYDVLKALDYFQSCRAEKDPRLCDAISLVQKKQNKNGMWKVQNRHPGNSYVSL